VGESGRARDGVVASGSLGGVQAGGEQPATRVWELGGAAMQRTEGRRFGRRSCMRTRSIVMVSGGSCDSLAEIKLISTVLSAPVNHGIDMSR
jgi:hypothetical protein